MKKLFGIIAVLFLLNLASFAQGYNEKKAKGKMTVPEVVKKALLNKYPQASKVTWEKENGNYEANWGGNRVRGR